jgi:hypothetical protein
MSEFLALTPPAPAVLTNPLQVAPYTNQERFDLAYEAAQATGRSFAAERNYRLQFDRAAEAFRAAGVDLENPFTDLANAYATVGLSPLSFGRANQARAERDRRLAAWDAAAARFQAENPDAADAFPNAAAVRLAADARAVQAFRANQAADQMGGGLGSFAGDVVGALQDPVQALTLPLGAPWRAGATGLPLLWDVARVAGIEAAIAGVTQAGIEVTAAPYRAQLGVEGDALGSIAAAAAGGAVLGGGLRGVVGLFQARGVPAKAASPTATPADIHAADAMTLAQAQLDELAGNPGGPQAVAQHQAAMDQAVAEVAGGRPAVSLSAAAVNPLRVPAIRLAPTDVEAAATEARRMIAAPSGSSYAMDFGQLPPQLAARLAADTQQDVAGFTLWMQVDEVKHAYKRHGPNGASVTVRPITPEDIAQAPNWFLTADRYEFDGYSRTGLPIIRAQKNLPDGRVAIVEEVRAGRQRLAFKSLYFEQGGGAPGTSRSGPDPTPRGSPRPQREPGNADDSVSPALARFNTYTPAGRAVLVEPQVVDLATLVPSHLDDGAPNPAYPHAEGVQPRDRGAAPSRDQVRAIAAGLIPERLAPNVEAGLGAPIVADDLVVESGNGRVLALREVFGNPALAQVADAYRSFLAAQGYDLAGIRNPVLISRRVSALSPAERRAFVQEANGRATLAQNVAERARADAARLDDALPLWRGGDVDSAANAPFVRRFLEGLTAEDRGSLLTGRGQLSAEGAARLRAAILARAYGDEMGPLLERFLDGDTQGLAGIAGALTDAAGRWATLRQAASAGEVDAAMDTTAELIGAVRVLTEARRLGISARELLLQGDLDRAPLTDMGRAFLAAMFRDPGLAGGPVRRDALAARLDGYVEEALKVRPGPDLFGTPPLRPEEVFDGARLREAPERAAAEPGEAPVFSFDAPPMRAAAPDAPGGAIPVADAPDPAAVRQAALLAEAERLAALRPRPDAQAAAELLDAQRIAANGDLQVPDLLGKDGATRGARDMLADAEAEMDAAAQAGVCMLGSLS